MFKHLIAALLLSSLACNTVAPALASTKQRKELYQMRLDALADFRAGKYESAEQTLKQLSDTPMTDRFSDWLVPEVLADLSDLYVKEGKKQLAESTLKRAIELTEARQGKQATRLVLLHLNLIRLYSNGPGWTEADVEREAKSALAIMDGCVSEYNASRLSFLQHVAAYYMYSEKQSAYGLPWIRSVYEIRSRSSGFLGNANSLGIAAQYGYALVATNHSDTAGPIFEVAMKCAEQRYGYYSVPSAFAMGMMAMCKEKLGKHKESEDLFAKVWKILERARPEDPIEMGYMGALAECLKYQKMMPAMRELEARALEPAKNQANMNHPYVYATGINLGNYAIQSNQPDIAVQYWKIAFENALHRQTPQGAELAAMYESCARQLEKVHRPDLARSFHTLAGKVSKSG